MFEVRLKRGHPTGEYRRGGEVFTHSEPKFFEEVPAVIANDPMLEVVSEEQADDEEKQKAEAKAAAKAKAKAKAKR